MIVSTADGPVTTIELAREAKRNALDYEMLADLSQAFTDAVDSGARVIVLSGRGTVFSAGADLSGPVYDPEFPPRLVEVIEQIESTPIPVIAAVNGPALGGGLQLAMAADLRVMAPEAICGIPAAKIGVALDEWTIRRLVSLVGGGPARGILIGCEPISADRAYDLGFANKIGDLADAQHWAATIAGFAPLTLRHYKMVLTGDGARDEAPADRNAAMLAAWTSEDAKEARAAREAKRAPVFTGK